MRTSLVVGASRQSIAYRDCCEETDSFGAANCAAGSERIMLNYCFANAFVGINSDQRRLGLADLCRELARIQIRAADTVNDSMEDAYAAGQIPLPCLNQPIKLDS
jgi:hypothetical protein